MFIEWGYMIVTHLSLGLSLQSSLYIVIQMATFALVFAATRGGGIGKDGKLPWPRLKADMAQFRTLTLPPPEKISVVVYGSRTWSLDLQRKPLPKRVNVVLSSQSREALGVPEDVVVCTSLDAALTCAQAIPTLHGVYVIGGAKVYEEAQHHPACTTVYMTEILFPAFACDTFFTVDPALFVLDSCSPIHNQEGTPTIHFQYMEYKRKTSVEVKAAVCTAAFLPSLPLPVEAPVEVKAPLQKRLAEYQYLDLVRDIIATGTQKTDRTGVGTLSKFGCVAKYSLRDDVMPLLTTKRVFWRGVVEELIWLIKGKTGAKDLQAKGVKIWDSNGTKAFLESIGQGDREEFDLGPIYGHQWRFFGAPYVDCHTDYKGQGIDQLAEIIQLIKKSPDSRRILMSAWNPMDLKRMALPPCHVICQFYVRPMTDGLPAELDCVMYQRSCDLGLGVPFNIASYALLTRMIAHVCGLRAGEFTHMMGDTHVYLTHVEPLTEQVARTPTPFPTMHIKRSVANIDDFTFDDFELIGYKPQADIKMAMAV